MSAPRDVNHETVMTEYLLGTLPAGERDEVEAAIAASPFYQERVMAHEDELLTRFHRGEVPADQSSAIARAYAATAPKRARLARAQALIDLSVRAREAVPPRERLLERVSRWFYGQPPIGRLALSASATLMVVAVPVLAYLALDARTELDRLRREGSASTAGADRGLVLAVRLLPGPNRGEGAETANRLFLPETAAEIWLQIELSDDVAGELAATVVRVDDASGSISASPVISRTTAGRLATVRVIAGRMKAGDYVLTLSSAGGETIATRSFRILRQ